MISQTFLILRTSVALAALTLVAAGTPAFADRIKHPTTVFAGLDKITGRIISFEVSQNETVQFGSLQVTPRVCYTRPATEAPLTDGFVEVEEVTAGNAFKKIFSGWMFAASPGLHGVEHPVYDVWLTDCKGGTEIIRDVVALPQEDMAAPATGGAATQRRTQPAQRPVGNPQPRATGAGALPQPGGPLPPAGSLVPPPPPVPPVQSRQGGLVPPGNIPNVPQQQQRRSPSQSFFPSQSQERLLEQ